MALVELIEEARWSEVRLANGGRRNALSAPFVGELLHVFDLAARRSDVVLVSAEGPVFCAGADTSERHLPSAAPGTRFLDALTSVDALLVGLVEGPALGAGLGALAAMPVVVASSEAWFSLPEPTMGRFAAGPGPFLEAVAPSRAYFDLAVSGSRIDADRAQALGFVSEVAAPELVREVAVRRVEALVSEPVVARQGRWYWQQRFHTPSFRALRSESLATLDRDYDATH